MLVLVYQAPFVLCMLQGRVLIGTRAVQATPVTNGMSLGDLILQQRSLPNESYWCGAACCAARDTVYAQQLRKACLISVTMSILPAAVPGMLSQRAPSLVCHLASRPCCVRA